MEIKQREFTFELTGYTPLLMHSPNQMAQPTSGRKKIPLPAEEAKRGLYALEDGQLYIPGLNIFQCLLAGATAFKVGKMSTSQYLAGTVFPSELPCLLISPASGEALTWSDNKAADDMRADSCENYLLVDARTHQPLSFGDCFVDVRRAVVKKNGVQRARARVPAWRTYVTFQVDGESFRSNKDAEDVILPALERAGQFIGLLDYRPQKRGPFGRFTVRFIPNGNGEPEAESETQPEPAKKRGRK